MERRKRRSAEDIDKSIFDAATALIQQGGFRNLTATGIMQKAGIEPVQFYKRYKDLDTFIDQYVRGFDYWFSDIVKESCLNTDIESQYKDILCNLFISLWNNKIMQELLKWEISTSNETSSRTAKLRELHTLPLCKKFGDMFADTETDIVALSALIIGGIYYLILHSDLSDFGEINLKDAQGRERMIKAVKYLTGVLFQTLSDKNPVIGIASAMKKDGMSPEKIAEYTRLPLSVVEELL